MATRAAGHIVKMSHPSQVASRDCPISSYCAGVACAECFESHLLLCHPILAAVIRKKTDVWSFRGQCLSQKECVGCFIATQMEEVEVVTVDGHDVAVVRNVKEADTALASLILVLSVECGARNKEGRERAVRTVAHRKHAQATSWLH